MVEPQPWTPGFNVPASLPPAAEGPKGRPLARWQKTILVVVGAAPGIGLSILPFLLLYLYEQSFIVTATPDSAFNVFTLGALACVLLAALFLIAALVLLFFKTLRIIGAAYLGGLVCGAGVGVLLAWVFVWW